jgi:ribonucleoside-diphosphate reductase alpha chain
MKIIKRNGSVEHLDISKIQKCCEWATSGLEDVSQSELETDSHLVLRDGISTDDIQVSLIKTAARKTSLSQPNWTYVASRLLMQRLYKHSTDGGINYKPLSVYLSKAVQEKRVDPKLLELFDLGALDTAIDSSRDFLFDYLGLTSLANRYLIKDSNDVVIELPQHFFMRVAMGKAMVEKALSLRTQKALDYYEIYSNFLALPSTPTLFNSGTLCPDDTGGIMETMTENAMYSKFAGGCATAFSSVRASGSRIKSTGGRAGGPIPYIKILNDVMNAWDQSGKRKGVAAVYLEPWHADIDSFLDLRQPGDERVRAHDVFPALWIPDLFMERVEQKAKWSLFDPARAPLLTETYGKEFEALYTKYESEGRATSQVDAPILWRKIIQRLSEEGVWWPCFKDEGNRRYAQPEIVRSSNLCVEIFLRTSKDRSSVCNLMSVNAGHDLLLLKKDGSAAGYEWNTKLEFVVRSAVRDLDSVITLGLVPHEKGRTTNQEDRPIGLGLMGFTLALQKLGIDYESAEQVKYRNELQRQMSLTAIDESANLAQELGAYPTFERSTWALGILPLDTATKRGIVEQFDLYISCDTPFCTGDQLRSKVKKGMRNSTLLALAPTASISNILGTTPVTELPYELEFEKENLNGQFNCVAPTAVNNPFNTKVKTARQVDQMWVVWSAAAGQLWTCQSQSTNIYLNEETQGDGPLISDIYFEGWRKGVKSFYYLRGISDTEQKVQPEPESAGAACFLRPGDRGFEECEACQ